MDPAASCWAFPSLPESTPGGCHQPAYGGINLRATTASTYFELRALNQENGLNSPGGTGCMSTDAIARKLIEGRNIMQILTAG